MSGDLNIADLLSQAGEIQAKLDRLAKIEKRFEELYRTRIMPMQHPMKYGGLQEKPDPGQVIFEADSFRYFLKLIGTEKALNMVNEIESKL